MYNQQRRKYESNSTSRMEKTGRTYPSSGTRDHSRTTKVWIHNRIYTGARGPAGRQIDDTVQRPGASATRRSSSLKQPQKHAACRAGKSNVLEIITLRAPSWGLATSLKQQATSVKLQAASRKLQASQIIVNKIQA